MRTEKWQRPTLGLVMGGKVENGSVSTPYGPLKAGLITTHRTHDQALEELLKCLERKAMILEYKYSEVLDTLEKDILPRVERLLTTIKQDTTD